MMAGAAKYVLMLASPEARASIEPLPDSILTCCTSVNPSPRNSSSATYCGAMQREGGVATSLSVVVSGGGYAATDSDFRPRSPAAPTKVSHSRNSRRLQPSRCRLSMGHLPFLRSHCLLDFWTLLLGSPKSQEESRRSLFSFILFTRILNRKHRPAACATRVAKLWKMVAQPARLCLSVEAQAMRAELVVTRRNLPHWELGGSTYFLTYRRI